MQNYSIQQLPKEERPRERLLRYGSESLATSELLALILGSGTKTKSALELSKELLVKFGNLRQLTQATLAELMEVKGIGLAKALQLKAALSLGVRASKYAIEAKYRIKHPDHAYYLIKDEIEFQNREHFIAILQDSKGYVICHEIISIGTLCETLVHPREFFYPAVKHKAASIIVAHNHPSGDPTPSFQDIALTKTLVEISLMLKIPLQDHLIIGHHRYFSLRQRGDLCFNLPPLKIKQDIMIKDVDKLLAKC